MMNGGYATNQSPDPPTQHGIRTHNCSFCSRSFATLQSLGGHLTSHRREITEMRRRHEAFMETRRLTLTVINESCGLPMVPLAPNYAFWEPYRRTGRQPKVVDFIKKTNIGAEEKLPKPIFVSESDNSSEKTVTDPFVRMVASKVEHGEEANSVSLDLTLKL